MVSKFCEQCGAPVEADASFCQQCAVTLKVQPAVEESAAGQPLQPHPQAVRQGKRQGNPPPEPITWEQEVFLLTDILTLKEVVQKLDLFNDPEFLL